MTVVAETERLIIRRFELSDAELAFAVVNDPSFLRFIGDRGVRTLDDAREYVRTGPMASYERFGFGLYVVMLKDNGTPIGMCGLLKRDYLDDPDVGYALLPEFRSRGYALESVAAVIAHGQRDFGLRRIVAIVHPENKTSLSVLRKLGFRPDGTVRPSAESEEIALFAWEMFTRAKTTSRSLLQHLLAALAYRTQKALRDAPPEYADFRAVPTARTPRELLWHMTSVIGYARTMLHGGTFTPPPVPTMDDEIDRFHATVAALQHDFADASLAARISDEQFLQGPLSDAMTHAGQLAYVRRLAGAPVAPENFIFAKIDTANTTRSQAEPVSPDPGWAPEQAPKQR